MRQVTSELIYHIKVDKTSQLSIPNKKIGLQELDNLYKRNHLRQLMMH